MPFFELTEQSRVATTWFLAYPGGDLMAIVFSDGPAVPWKLVVRARLQVDDADPFESNDQAIEGKCLRRAGELARAQEEVAAIISGYEIHRGPDDESRDDLVRRTDVMFDGLRLARPAHKFWREEINGGAEAFATRWSKLPFSHVKVAAAQGPKEPQ